MSTVVRYDAQIHRWLVVNPVPSEAGSSLNGQGKDGQVQASFLNGRAGVRAAYLARLRLDRPDLYQITLDFILNRRADPDEAIKAALSLLDGKSAATETEQAVVEAAKLPAQPAAFDLLIATRRWGTNSKTSGDEPILWTKLAGKPQDNETYAGLTMLSPQVRKLLERYEWVRNENREFQLIRKFRRVQK
ncbi:MAG: hypothetical protein KJ077_11245 [Anaerolineae bacterium]|nr:hypothetical protein [Anaerolineae bacterium]